MIYIVQASKVHTNPYKSRGQIGFGERTIKAFAKVLFNSAPEIFSMKMLLPTTRGGGED